MYAIFNKDIWIYVGVSADLQTRLIEHLNGTDAVSQRIKSYSPTGFLFEINPLPDSRALRQTQLISELRPVCNLTQR